MAVNYLIVGGGGGGGCGVGNARAGGGGGGGGFKTDNVELPPASYDVVVGVGGARGASNVASGTNGGDSSVTGLPTAIGGGGGGSGEGGVPGNGASGGGAGDNGGAFRAGGTGSDGRNGGSNSNSAGSGGSGGGGGGYNGVGSNGSVASTLNSPGGPGGASAISGAVVLYCAGGTGGGYTGGTNAAAPTPNSGNGGGGGNGQGGQGSNGAAGVVIFSYVTGSIIASGGTITTSGGRTIHTYTANGTFTITAPNTPLAGDARFAVSAVADLQVVPLNWMLSGAAAFGVSASGALFISAHNLAASAGIRFATSATIPPAGLSAASSIAFATGASLRAGSPLSAAATIAFATSASIRGPVAELAAVAAFNFATLARLKAVSGRVQILLNGQPGRVRVGSVTIRDVLNDAPNTATLTVDGNAPREDQTLVIRVENDATAGLLFVGTLQTIGNTYDGSSAGHAPRKLQWPCNAIDTTARLNHRLPFGTFVDVSASLVAKTIAAQFAPEFSTAGIVNDLPPVRVTFDGSDSLIACLSRLANLIGGYTKVEDYIVYLFLDDELVPPDPIDASHCFLDEPPITVTRDVSQVRTRVYGKGHGEPLLSDVLASESILPIKDAVMFNPLGGQAIAGVTPDGATSEILAYTAIDLGGGGSLVGPGAAPSSAPSGTPQVGAGLAAGVYRYGYTDVTPSGESLPSPIGVVVVSGTLADPTTPPSVSARAGNGIESGVHGYAVSFVTAAGETRPTPIANVTHGPTVASPTAIGAAFNYAFGAGRLQVNSAYGFAYTFRRLSDGAETGLSPIANIVTTTTGNVGIPLAGCSTPPAGWVRQWYHTPAGGGALKKDSYAAESNNFNTEVGGFDYDVNLGAVAPASNATNANTTDVSNIAIGPAGTTARRVYRTRANASILLRLVEIADNSTTTALDATPDAGLGVAAPTVNTTIAFQVVVSGIAIGPGATTGRKLYRTVANGSQLKLLTTIANNAATSYTDTAADGALGANVPGGDTSGLAQIAGQVLAGSSSIPTAGAGVFGPANVPGVAPAVAAVPGLGIETGDHAWAYTWVLPTGESSPSPVAHATMTDGPAAAPTFVGASSNASFSRIDPAFNPGDLVEWVFTYSKAAAFGDFSRESAPSPATPPFAATVDPAKGSPNTFVIRHTVQSASDPAVTWINCWRRVNGGPYKYAGGDINVVGGGVVTFSSNSPSGPSPYGDPLPAPAVEQHQAQLTGIATGPAGTTARKVYRTIAGGAQLKLAATLADNVTTAYLDTASDSTLGAVVPAGGGSGGGWAIIGNGAQVIRYTGILGNTLIGIPPAGPGAITASIGYNSTITVAPALRNISGLRLPLLKGAAVHLWIQRDDLAAQAELAAGSGGDGIIEHRLVDARRGEPSLMAMCDADLKMFARPLVTVQYATRDMKTKSGKTIVIDLASPPIHETLTIQDVTIDEIGIADGLLPRFKVTASSVRYSLEDLIRQIAGVAAVID